MQSENQRALEALIRRCSELRAQSTKLAAEAEELERKIADLSAGEAASATDPPADNNPRGIERR